MDTSVKNMKFFEIKAYKTTDNHVFEDWREAEAHQNKLDFLEWYENSKCYGNSDGCHVEGDDMLEWLSENSEYLKKFLK